MTLATRLAAPEPGWSITADVVVVGSGIAGLTTALELREYGRRVALVTKTELASGSTIWAQGGIAAALGPQDSADAHLADTLAAGAGLCDREAVHVLVTDGPKRVRELIGLGTKFDRDVAGELSLTREGGHHANRIAHAGGDATGAEISRALVHCLERIKDDPGIEIIEGALVLDVLTGTPTSDGPAPVTGVTLHVIGQGSRDGVGAILAPAVVLATGGIGQVYRASTNPLQATADGQAAALRAGAALADMEFVQFHPTVLWQGSGARGQLTLISEAMRGEGAVLVDVHGERFMTAVHPMAELAPRDVVAHAIVRQCRETGADHVYLDARHLGAEFLAERFPTIDERLRAEGFDFSTELIPVAPAQHYHSGGVLTDTSGQTNVPGLYAVGEVACTGVHGANRLASNSLLEGLVFGYRAAISIAELIDRRDLVQRDPVTRPGHAALLHAATRTCIQQLAAIGPGVVRTSAGLAEASAGLTQIGVEALSPPPAQAEPQVREWETTNLHQVATVLTAAAWRREESRGGHFRADFPEPSTAWQSRIVTRLDADAALESSTVPVVTQPLGAS